MNRANTVFEKDPKQENIINNFGHSFVEDYLGDRLIDFVLDSNLGNLDSANDVKRFYKNMQKNVWKIWLSKMEVLIL